MINDLSTPENREQLVISLLENRNVYRVSVNYLHTHVQGSLMELQIVKSNHQQRSFVFRHNSSLQSAFNQICQEMEI